MPTDHVIFRESESAQSVLAANSGWMWHLQKWYILTSDKAKAAMIVIGAVNAFLLGLINLFYL